MRKREWCSLPLPFLFHPGSPHPPRRLGTFPAGEGYARDARLNLRATLLRAWEFVPNTPIIKCIKIFEEGSRGETFLKKFLPAYHLIFALSLILLYLCKCGEKPLSRCLVLFKLSAFAVNYCCGSLCHEALV